MSFVIYDVETTGLNRRFDQIVQFAAILTDSSLNIKDQFQTCCRLMPHIIPSPEAMHVTGLRIEQVIDASLPSHYAMVTEIRQTLESWCPALFLGFNSLSFDEEFLRQAFYQCLYSPFLTNTRGSARADVLHLCRMVGALRADVMKPATDENDHPIFSLKALAKANGITPPMSHGAMGDALTTLELCRFIKSRAPEVWSQYLRFSQKAAVESFVTNEEAFVVSETVGNHHRTRVVTPIGRHSERAIRYYCLDVDTDLDTLRGMSEHQLIYLCKSSSRPIVTVRTNAAPTLWALYEASKGHLAPFEDEAEILEWVAQIREDRPLLERLRKAAQAAEPVFPPSPHVEEQIYEGKFPLLQDEDLMQRFQTASWEERATLAQQFVDERYCRLALQLIYFERPDFLNTEDQCAADEEVRKRLVADPFANVPWRSIPAAQRQLKALLDSGLEGNELTDQLQYLVYLEERADEFAQPMSA